MGIQDLQAFLESNSLEGGSVSVDLLKIARNVTQRQQPHNSNRKIRPIGNKLKLIVDAENCLDRLYGGYFSDWACGGQWNRMVQFLSLLTQAVEKGNIELAVVFNGTIESCRMNDWVAQQAVIRQKVGMVLKHVNNKATPPPKIWWTAPICLKTALRMALRHLGITVMCTMDDHHQEVIAYCREYGFHGLLADDAEYAAFDPPRYFSSEHLKLTYKGSLETKEYMVSELTKSLQLSREQICVLSSLLGNFLLPENDLQDIYKKIFADKLPLPPSPTTADKQPVAGTGELSVKLIADYVRDLPYPSTDMEALLAQIFGSSKDKRASVFKQSVLYYLNGTADGFLKYCTPKTNSNNNYTNNNKQQRKNNHNMNNNISATLNNLTIKQEDADVCVDAGVTLGSVSGESSETDLLATLPVAAESSSASSGVAVFASETTEQEQESLQQYKLAMVNQVMSVDIINLVEATTLISNTTTASDSSTCPPSATSEDTTPRLNGHHQQNNSSNGGAGDAAGGGASAMCGGGNVINPSASADVLRTSSLRHQKGLMSPWILHVLGSKEVRLPCLMEDENNREFPSIHEIFLPLRQRIYAVLFNLHHHRYVHAKKMGANESGGGGGDDDGGGSSPQQQPDVIIKEWGYSRGNPYQTADEVKAEPLPWAVPTLQRLWFGPSLDDKRRRMRALLSCLNSDTPLILNISYVPQHLLVMACVLRYVMSLSSSSSSDNNKQHPPILRRSELDVFLCQAFNPDLMNAQYLQELTLSVVTSRGVQLAAVFMQGVDVALLANDACGAPLPWLMCCPWLYFDGKLFHHTLTRATHAKSLLDLCENHIDRVVKVERIRKAILEGLDVKFAKIPLPHYGGGVGAHLRCSGAGGGIRPPPNCLPAVPLPSSRGAANNLRHRPVSSRGGQLQIAGVVVGSWGANLSGAASGGYQNMRPLQHLPQHQQHHHHHQQQQQRQHQSNIMPQGYRGGVVGGGVGGGGSNNRLGGNIQYPHYHLNRSQHQYYEQQQHQQRGGGGGNTRGGASGRAHHRKPAAGGLHTTNANFPNHKRNTNKKKNKQKQQHSVIDGGVVVVPVRDTQKSGAENGLVVGELAACIEQPPLPAIAALINDDCKSAVINSTAISATGPDHSHQGQGDGPNIQEAGGGVV